MNVNWTVGKICEMHLYNLFCQTMTILSCGDAVIQLKGQNVICGFEWMIT